MAKHVTVYKGKSKKDGKEFRALRIEIGDWTQLYFPKTKFEMDYIEKQLNSQDTTEDTKEREEFASGFDI